MAKSLYLNLPKSMKDRPCKEKHKQRKNDDKKNKKIELTRLSNI